MLTVKNCILTALFFTRLSQLSWTPFMLSYSVRAVAAGAFPPSAQCFSVLLRPAFIWSKEQTQIIWFPFILVHWVVPIWGWEGGRRPLVRMASPCLRSGTWPLCFGFFNILLQILDAHFHWSPEQLHLGDSLALKDGSWVFLIYLFIFKCSASRQAKVIFVHLLCCQPWEKRHRKRIGED